MLSADALCLFEATGLLDPEAGFAYQRKYGIFLRVMLNGVDVTNRCKLANDREGWVLLNKHDADGREYLNEYHEVATEYLEGDVRLIPT